jgi:hypothetical protein
VLSTVLHTGQWDRTSARLEEAADGNRCWVEIPSVTEARKALEQHGVCLITGLAGVDKTLLADRLVLGAVSKDRQVVEITRKLDRAWDLVSNPDKRFYYFDDFPGHTKLRSDATDDAPDLDLLITYARRHRDRARLVLTSRDQVLVLSWTTEDFQRWLKQVRHGAYARCADSGATRPQRCGLRRVDRRLSVF